jgi:Adenylate and Guanylate cyclase catalytic domain
VKAVEGYKATFAGNSVQYDVQSDDLSFSSEFAKFSRFDGNRTSQTVACDYTKTIYATSKFRETYSTNQPVVFTVIVVCVFIFTAMSFFLYDVAVQRRNDKVVKTAARTTEIVSSIFPKAVHERMMQEAEEREQQEEMFKRKRKRSNSADLFDFVNLGKEGNKADASMCESAEEPMENWNSRTKPIADFFPTATILFADIVGFTAWSSTREPCQVFVLLESIFHEFDLIAKRRGVYKVETIGDCYVAVCGLPVPRKDHVVVMCRFARDCVNKVHSVLRQLEIELGPDTAELGMRFGLHSGSVTAGVLRGER